MTLKRLATALMVFSVCLPRIAIVKGDHLVHDKKGNDGIDNRDTCSCRCDGMKGATDTFDVAGWSCAFRNKSVAVELRSTHDIDDTQRPTKLILLSIDTKLDSEKR